MANVHNVELGILTALPTTLGAVRLARAAETLGFDRMGVGDTAPELYHSCYPAVTAILLQTERLRVGPYVTNPVTRHWSIHGATARAFEEIAPGRFFLGMGAGDGAVHSVGLRPATLAEINGYVTELRRMLPSSAPLHMAFSGPKGVAMAGVLASELTIGAGLDPVALRELARRARAARRAANVSAPLKIWALAPVFFANSATEILASRAAAAGLANAAARFTFHAGFEGKNVPEVYEPIIRRKLDRYDFGHHAEHGGNPNAKLFDDHPEVRDYIIDRFTIVGNQVSCADRLEKVVREAELDGVWLVLAAPLHESGKVIQQANLAAQTFGHLRKISSPAAGGILPS
jgi:alkanesulfonate monooxygenase SsuD/methylene tetrahydromethanopterin reductase-like flavin-dependent oxidoreductase (luciferase family)